MQIDQFIRHNKLDSDWQIIASEVEEDMMMIVKRIGNVAPSIPRNPIAPKLSATGAKVKKVKNYREYQLLLEKAIELNGKKELSSYQIDDFVRRNNLYVDWGIVTSEVKKDMEDLLSQYQQLSANASPFVKKQVTQVWDLWQEQVQEALHIINWLKATTLICSFWRLQ